MCTTLVESLSNLHKLEILDIGVVGGGLDLMREGWVPPRHLHKLRVRENLFQALPTWINPSSLPLLSYLEISVSKVRSKDIQLIGLLRALRYLRLWGDGNFSGEHVLEKSVVTIDAFPRATDCNFCGIVAVPSIFPRGAAPRLKRLVVCLPAKWIARGDFDLSMGHLPSLKRVSVDLSCKEASDEEVAKAHAALRAAAGDHPNRLRIKIRKY